MSHFVYLFDRREGHSVSLSFLPNMNKHDPRIQVDVDDDHSFTRGAFKNAKYRNIGYIQFIKMPPVKTYMTTYRVQINKEEFDLWDSLWIDEDVLLEVPELDLMRIIQWKEFESKLGMTYKTIGHTHKFNIDKQKLSDFNRIPKPLFSRSSARYP
jgi:hypothetical protein